MEWEVEVKRPRRSSRVSPRPAWQDPEKAGRSPSVSRFSLKRALETGPFLANLGRLSQFPFSTFLFPFPFFISRCPVSWTAPFHLPGPFHEPPHMYYVRSTVGRSMKPGSGRGGSWNGHVQTGRWDLNWEMGNGKWELGNGKAGVAVAQIEERQSACCAMPGVFGWCVHTEIKRASFIS